jgi:hypothetical protein
MVTAQQKAFWIQFSRHFATGRSVSRTPFSVESPFCNTVSPGGGGPKMCKCVTFFLNCPVVVVQDVSHPNMTVK